MKKLKTDGENAFEKDNGCHCKAGCTQNYCECRENNNNCNPDKCGC